MVLDKSFSEEELQHNNDWKHSISSPLSPCNESKPDDAFEIHSKSPTQHYCNNNKEETNKFITTNSELPDSNNTFISVHELAAKMEEEPLNLLILDCRSQIRYDLAHLATSINVDIVELISSFSSINVNTKNNDDNNNNNDNNYISDSNFENEKIENNENIMSDNAYDSINSSSTCTKDKMFSSSTKSISISSSPPLPSSSPSSSPILLRHRSMSEEYAEVASSPKFEAEDTTPTAVTSSILSSSPPHDSPLLRNESVTIDNEHDKNVSSDDNFNQFMLKPLNNISAKLLEKNLSCYEDKLLFRQREFCHVIVYDDGVPENNPELALTTFSPAFIMHTLLKKEGICTNISILQGGYGEFAECYQCMCHPPVNCGIDTSFLPSLEERIKCAHNRIFQSLSREIKCDMPSKIFSHLYLGDAQNSFNIKQLQKLKIRHIINTAGECENHHPDVLAYDKFHLVDNEHENVKQYFDDAFSIIEECRKQKRRVLVHCFMGISRSVSIVIAYIMKYKKWTLKKAYRYVREKRKIIDPNLGFMKQLFAYEKELFGFTSLPLYFLEPASDS